MASQAPQVWRREWKSSLSPASFVTSRKSVSSHSERSCGSATDFITSLIDGQAELDAARNQELDESLRRRRARQELTDTIASIEFDAISQLQDQLIDSSQRLSSFEVASGLLGGKDARRAVDASERRQRAAERELAVLQRRWFELLARGNQDSLQANERAVDLAQDRVALAQAEEDKAIAAFRAILGEPEALERTALLNLQDGVRVQQTLNEFEQNRSTNAEQYVKALNRQLEIGKRLESLATQSRALAEQESQARLNANEKALELAQKRLDVVRREADAARAQLQSGAERFASKSVEDQELAKRAIRKARTQGAESPTDEERARIRGLGAEADRFARQADTAEAALLPTLWPRGTAKDRPGRSGVAASGRRSQHPSRDQLAAQAGYRAGPGRDYSAGWRNPPQGARADDENYATTVSTGQGRFRSERHRQAAFERNNNQ